MAHRFQPTRSLAASKAQSLQLQRQLSRSLPYIRTYLADADVRNKHEAVVMLRAMGHDELQFQTVFPLQSCADLLVR